VNEDIIISLTSSERWVVCHQDNRILQKNDCVVTSLFDYLWDVCRDSLASNVQEKMIQTNTLLYQPPQRITPIFEVVKGVVKVGSHSSKGEEVTHYLLKPGDFFGNLQYLNVGFSEFAKTLTPVHLRTYDPTFFRKVTTGYPEVSEWFAQKLVGRWYQAENQLFTVTGLNAPEKVTRTMLQYRCQVEDASGRWISILDLMTLQDIADLTGMTRQTVSKVVKKIDVNAIKKGKSIS